MKRNRNGLWLADFLWSTPALWLTCDHFVGKVSAVGQPTRPIQPCIPIFTPFHCHRAAPSEIDHMDFCGLWGHCGWYCSCSPLLAAFTTVGRLQSCIHGVLCTEWSVSAIPGSATLCCWSTWSSSSALVLVTSVPAYRLATVGRRSFPAAASNLWNSLPPYFQSSASLTNFCHKLKNTCSSIHFQTFFCNYPHIDFAFVDFVMTSVILATLEILIWLVDFYVLWCNILGSL